MVVSLRGTISWPFNISSFEPSLRITHYHMLSLMDMSALLQLLRIPTLCSYVFGFQDLLLNLFCSVGPSFESYLLLLPISLLIQNVF